MSKQITNALQNASGSFSSLESGEEEELELFTMPVTTEKHASPPNMVPTLKDPYLVTVRPTFCATVVDKNSLLSTTLIETLLPPVTDLPKLKRSGKEVNNSPYLKAAPGFCEMCYHIRAEYKCPACQLQTCSLKCCQKHKKDFNCSGKKKASQFVSLKEMGNETLFEDLRFLEDVERVVEAAERDVITKRAPQRKKKPRLANNRKMHDNN